MLYTIFPGRSQVIRSLVDHRCDPLAGGRDDGARC
jgi:hypothetical protein